MSSDQDSLYGSGNCLDSFDNKIQENYSIISASAQHSTPYPHNPLFIPCLSPQTPQSRTPVSDDMFSPIPQFDGNISLPDITHPNHPPAVSTHDTPGQPCPTLTNRSHPSVSNYMATFSLDRPKQLRKLRQDTNVSDYTIEVSPSNENVNIYCSTGFYAVVAKPTLESLAIGTSAKFGDINMP